MNTGDLEPGSYAATQQSLMPDEMEPEQFQHSFFSTPELTQRLDLLRHLTDNSERVVILKGPGGAGKSTLLSQFKAQARPEWQVCTIEADPMLQPDQLFAQLFRCYGLDDGAVGDIEDLISRFIQIQSEDGLAVVVVDDAHLLPVATIIALLRLYERRPGERALARIILFAAAEITDQLHTPQIQAMNLQSIQELEIPQLSVEQCGQFIDHILGGKSSGLGVQHLAGGAVRRICNDGGGWPGQIENQILSLMQSNGQPKTVGATSSIKGVIEDLPRSVLLGVPILGVILLLTLVFQDQINEFFEASEATVVEKIDPDSSQPVIPLKLPVESKTEGNLVAEAKLPIEVSPALLEPVKHKEMPVVEPPTISSPISPRPSMESRVELSVDAKTSVVPLRDQLDATQVIKLPLVAAGEGKIEEVNPKIKTKKSPTLVALSPRSKAIPKQIVTLPATKIVESAQPAPVSEPKLPPVKESSTKTAKISKVVAIAPKPAPVKEVGVKVKSVAWFKKQRPERYTLQLIGVQDERAARQFIKNHKIGAEAAYFTTLRNGKPWYSVVHGVYSGRDAAVLAKKKLPTGLRSGAGWPRSFGSIQEVLTP